MSFAKVIIHQLIGADFIPELFVVHTVETSRSIHQQPVLCVPLQDNLVFIVGKIDGLMVVSGRRHNADDVVATALAVEPMKFVYRGR